MKMERQTLTDMPCYSSRHYAPLPDHDVPCRIRSGRRLQTARSNRAHGSASSSNSLAFRRLAMKKEAVEKARAKLERMRQAVQALKAAQDPCVYRKPHPI